MKLAVLLIALAIVLPINAQEKRPKSDAHQSSTENVKEAPYAEENGAENHPKSYLSRLFSPENLPNIGLFVAGVIGIWVAIGTLNHMRESSERQLRAYVVAELGNIVNIADPIPTPGLVQTEARRGFPGWGPVIRVQIKNTGQTPAFKVLHWGAVTFREYPLTSNLPSPPTPTVISSTLGAGIVSTKTLFFGPALTVEQIAELRAGTSAIYVNGEIRYRDAFNQEHFTRYRLMHHVSGGAIGISTDLSFAEGGNDAN
jgi:hypothetical protein